MDGHHQGHRRRAEPVQPATAPACAPHHTSLQRVTITPSTLSPEIWQGEGTGQAVGQTLQPILGNMEDLEVPAGGAVGQAGAPPQGGGGPGRYIPPAPGHACSLSGRGAAHVAEVPGLMADAGHILPARRIAQHKAEVGAAQPEGPAHPLVGKGGTDKVDGGLVLTQVDGQTGLVLAAPRAGHIGLGKLQPPAVPGCPPRWPPAGPWGGSRSRAQWPSGPPGCTAAGPAGRRPAVQQDVRASGCPPGPGCPAQARR